MSGVAEELVRESRIARATGTEVKLIDADHPECTDYDSAEGGRWVTVCSDHGNFVQHGTWKLARQHLGHPEEWCEGCQGSAPAGDPNGGFSEEERERALVTRKRKAEERRAERNAEAERKQEKRNLEEQWTHWTVHKPFADVRAIYRPADKEAHGAALKRHVDAETEARKAKRGLRAAEESLRDLAKPKTKRERANLARLEKEAEELDQRAVSEKDLARIAGEEATRLARIAYLRGCLAGGWKLGLGGYSRPRRFIEKGDRQVWIPADYLEADGYSEAELMPEEEVSSDD